LGRLDAKDALVTGAAAGIGRAIALRFAAEGARVVAVDVDRSGAERTAKEIAERGGRALHLSADVGDRESVGRLFAEVASRLGALHILVNNAGIALRRRFEHFPPADWERVWSVNLMGAVWCTQAAVPLLRREPPGKVVNVASIEVSRHVRKLSAYAASKGALASLSRSLALELAPDGIQVNYLCPGFIRTEMTRPYLDRWLFRKYVEHRTPGGRLGEPDDVAKVAVFLASSDADFVTGEGITVDGGLTLRAF
jgi:NAD(P)-dependent dehydrogenase (short-subunit alcohol dehydrogenase family)